MTKKVRKEIPSDLAAKVLFYSDRTCCVCRNRSKPVQIHHIDEDPSNNTFLNLAVLCLDCHNDTMIRGGFGRKLNADQVILYRDDWLKIVQRSREKFGMNLLDVQDQGNDSNFLEYITSVTEIYRENKKYSLLAGLYDSLGNIELRDKYIEIAIAENPSDDIICHLRGKQGKPELIPEDVKKRMYDKFTKNNNFSQRARFHMDVGLEIEAAKDYIADVKKSLDEGKFFSAAFYLKEMIEENLITRLFEEALKDATERDDLWWQVRALQELGWNSELNDLLIKNTDFINASGNTTLQAYLAKANQDSDKYLELRKKIASSIRIVNAGAEDSEEDKEND